MFKNIPVSLIKANFLALFKNLSFAKTRDERTSKKRIKIKKTI